MIGQYSVVYLLEEMAPHVSRIESQEIREGLGGLSGNKGAVLIKFQLLETRLCLLNVHLESGVGNAVVRYCQLVNILKLGKVWNEERNRWNFDVVVCAGDFNFRLAKKRHRASQMASLQSLDKQRGLGRPGTASGHQAKSYLALKELPIQFPPTYKLEPGTAQFDMTRQPAWCDRILYAGKGVKIPSLATAVNSTAQEQVLMARQRSRDITPPLRSKSREEQSTQGGRERDGNEKAWEGARGAIVAGADSANVAIDEAEAASQRLFKSRSEPGVSQLRKVASTATASSMVPASEATSADASETPNGAVASTADASRDLTTERATAASSSLPGDTGDVADSASSSSAGDFAQSNTVSENSAAAVRARKMQQLQQQGEPLAPILHSRNFEAAYKGYTANFDCAKSDHRPVILDYVECVYYVFHDKEIHGALLGDEDLAQSWENVSAGADAARSPAMLSREVSTQLPAVPFGGRRRSCLGEGEVSGIGPRGTSQDGSDFDLVVHEQGPMIPQNQATRQAAEDSNTERSSAAEVEPISPGGKQSYSLQQVQPGDRNADSNLPLRRDASTAVDSEKNSTMAIPLGSAIGGSSNLVNISNHSNDLTKTAAGNMSVPTTGLLGQQGGRKDRVAPLSLDDSLLSMENTSNGNTSNSDPNGNTRPASPQSPRDWEYLAPSPINSTAGSDDAEFELVESAEQQR
ncbi:unnamed protein product [Amoebophrya sp. A25]|nr:unnamed protein product [Amoebophrya sp. A25]|eukprot:GSA25T00005203001.1